MQMHPFVLVFMIINSLISFFGAFIIFFNKGFRESSANRLIGGIFLSQGCYMF